MSIMSDIIGVSGSALTGGVFGAVARVGTEVMSYFNEKQKITVQKMQNDHELEMVREMAVINTAKEQREVNLQQLHDELVMELQEIKNSMTVQTTPSGNKFIDAWNGALRPWLVSIFLVLYTLYKIMQLILCSVIAWKDVSVLFHGAKFGMDDVKRIIGDYGSVWSDFEITTMSGIINFLLVGRVFDKIRHGK